MNKKMKESFVKVLKHEKDNIRNANIPYVLVVIMTVLIEMLSGCGCKDE